EEVILDAILFGHKEIVRLVEFQEKIIAEVGKEKSEITVFEINPDIQSEVANKMGAKLVEAIQVKEKHEREDAIASVKEEALALFEDEEDEEVLKHVKLAM